MLMQARQQQQQEQQQHAQEEQEEGVMTASQAHSQQQQQQEQQLLLLAGDEGSPAPHQQQQLEEGDAAGGLDAACCSQELGEDQGDQQQQQQQQDRQLHRGQPRQVILDTDQTTSDSEIEMLEQPAQRACQHYRVQVPCTGSAMYHYPFALHGAKALPFTVIQRSGSSSSSSYICLQSTACTGVAAAGGDNCKPCSDLQFRTDVRNIESRAADPTVHCTHISNEYLTFAQLQRKYEKQRADRGSERLKVLKQDERLLTVKKKLQLHDAFVMALSDTEGRVPRLQQLVRVALRNGEGIGGILSRLHAALAGNYRPQGWSSDQIAFDMGYLVLHIGGPHLLTALNREGMLPSANWVRQHSQGLPKLVSPLAVPGCYGADRTDDQLQGTLQQVLITNIEAVVLQVSRTVLRLGCQLPGQLHSHMLLVVSAVSSSQKAILSLSMYQRLSSHRIQQSKIVLFCTCMHTEWAALVVYAMQERTAIWCRSHHQADLGLASCLQPTGCVGPGRPPELWMAAGAG